MKKVNNNTAPKTEAPVQEATANDRFQKSFFLNSKTVLQLVLKSVLLLIIPYAYLFLCGLIFDSWLKMYQMTTFIFCSLLILYVIALAVIIWAVVRYVKGRRKL